ncbi:MAG: phosphatase PAP2 family protein, partial [Chitinispirillaceae bacterium]
YSKSVCVFLCTIVSLCLFSGCSRNMLKANPLENPDITPSRSRVESSLRDAVLDPAMLIGGTTLALLLFSGMDDDISSYVSERKPLFGSRERALKMSDHLRLASMGTAALLYTVKYYPVEPEYGSSSRKEGQVSQRISGPVAGAEALLVSGILTAGTTELFKRTTGRLRPDSSDHRSFLSGHTSVTAVANSYSANTLNSMSLPSHYRFLAQGTLIAMTFTTAWARLEGSKHYPTDLVAGAMLGTFFGNFIFKSFLGPYQPLNTEIDLNVTPEGCAVRLALRL